MLIKVSMIVLLDSVLMWITALISLFKDNFMTAIIFLIKWAIYAMVDNRPY
jgi:hypothetical protein